MKHFYEWLDTAFFPRFERFVTHPLFIMSLLILGVVLMVDDNPLLQLKGGNFTNVTSAALGCVVLLQTISHKKQSVRHHDEIQQIHKDYHQQIMSAMKAAEEKRGILTWLQLQKKQPAKRT